jgi:hypothetical protein
VHRSEVFPGLWLDPKALVETDLNQVLGVFRQGLADPTRGDFVAKLNPGATG